MINSKVIPYFQGGLMAKLLLGMSLRWKKDQQPETKDPLG